MNFKFKSIAFIFSIIIILHISAILFGWYQTKIIWIDNVQHILAGIAFAILFLLINRNKENKLKIGEIIIFVLFIAILWELFEFLLLTLLPTYAKKFSLYSPNLIESLEDIISNVIGGIIFAIWYLKKKIR